MTHDEFAAEIDRITARAREVFATDGHHAPILLAYMPDGLTIGLLKLTRPAQRRAVFEGLVAKGARALIFVTETWAAIAETPADSEIAEAWSRGGGSLEHLPGRKEFLMVIGAHPGGCELRSMQICRDGDGATLADMQLPGAIDGIMSDLPWAA